MKRTRRFAPRALAEQLEPRQLLTQLADLDRDGDQDAYYQGDWYENSNGKGDFVRHVIAANVMMSQHGDLDGDGDFDLVVAPLAWFENDGQGPRVSHSLPNVGFQNVQRIKLTDVGNDGRIDVVVFGEGRQALLRNLDGQGQFTLELSASVASVVDAADIDRDGDLDLLVLDDDSLPTRAVLERNEGGIFQREVLFEDQEGPTMRVDTVAISWQDMDGDAQLDLVWHGVHLSEFLTYYARFAWVPMSQALQTIRDGTLIQGGCFNTPSGNYGLFQLKDVDHDGDLDSWCKGEDHFESRVASALNDGKGLFSEVSNFAITRDVPLNLTDAGDLNRDGTMDYISSTFENGSPVWVDGLTRREHLQTAPSLFADRPITFGTGNRYSHIQLADVQADGKLEALVSRGSNLEVWQSLGQGANSWLLRQSIDVTSDLRRFVVSELDGRNGVDVVVTTATGVRVLQNDGSGNLVLSSVVLGASSPDGIAVGDLDEDGDRDLLVAFPAVAGGERALQPWFNDSQGRFAKGQAFSESGVSRVQLGDFDSDGDLDAVVLSSATTRHRIWWNDSKGVFSSASVEGAPVSAVDLAVADLDRDDASDFYVIRSNSSSDMVFLREKYLLGSPLLQTGEQEPLALALGDLDNDGDFDAVLATDKHLNSSVLLNSGKALFVPTNDTLTTARSAGVALGDADGDGDLDAFFANDDSIQLFLNGVNPTTPQAELLPPAPAPRFDDHANTVDAATRLKAPTSRQPIHVAGEREFNYDVDVFTFAVTPFARYRIRALGNVKVTAPDGSQVDGFSLAEVYFARVGNQPVEQLYVEVTGPPGSYELAVDLVSNDHGSSWNDATRVSVPSVTSGYLRSLGEEDWMQFAVEPGKTYDIQLQAEGKSQASLWLLDPLRLAGTDANGFARILLEPDAIRGDVIFAKVTCDCSGELGYTLVVTEANEGGEVKGDVMGDASFDGVFDSFDLIQIFSYGQFEDDEEDNSHWWSGDWDGDGDFTTADLVLAMQAGTYRG